MLPRNTTTIEEFVSSGYNVTFSYYNLSLNDVLSNGTVVSVYNVINEYIDELKDESIYVTLNQEQQFKYMYKPKLLCTDIYGNPELYFIILLINDIADVKEFTKSTLRMIPKDRLFQLLSLIFNAEKKSISDYNNK